MLERIRDNVSGLELPNISSKTSTTTSSQGYARLDNQLAEDPEDSIMFPVHDNSSSTEVSSSSFMLHQSVKPAPHPCTFIYAFIFILISFLIS